jgi:menaquinone-9 beta-reductase
VNRVRLCTGTLSSHAPLPAPAVGVSRRRLDGLMLDLAQDAGTGIEWGVKASRLDAGQLILQDGTHVNADSLFIATGKHELRGLGRALTPSPVLGLRVRLAPHPSLLRQVGDTIELHLFEGGYAGLILQEDGAANLCMALDKRLLSAAGGDPARFIRALGDRHPILGERLAFISEAPSVLAIAAIPYGWIAQSSEPGLFRLGDQAACIPSLAGEGVGLALASGVRAAEAWSRGGPGAAPAYQRDFAAACKRPVALAKLLWRWGERPFLAPAMIKAVGLAPSLARLAAQLTRIAPRIAPRIEH